jgi:hypothetical protein
LTIETNDTSMKFIISIYYFMVIFSICYLGFIIDFLTWSNSVANVIHQKKKKILLKDNNTSSKMCFHHNFQLVKKIIWCGTSLLPLLLPHVTFLCQCYGILQVTWALLIMNSFIVLSYFLFYNHILAHIIHQMTKTSIFKG